MATVGVAKWGALAALVLTVALAARAEQPRKPAAPANTDTRAAAVSHGSTITFDNRSGVPALVKLMGPRGTVVSVPNGAERTVEAANGTHYILVRYGDNPDHYAYTKGNSFTVEDNRHRISKITIALHKVVHGNYPSRPTSREEFEHAELVK